MAIPYNTTNAGTSIRDALGHSSIGTGFNQWQHLEEIHVKHSNAWQKTKEVYVKSGGSWRLVHEGEHFLFQATLTGAESEFNLGTWISGQGYSGNKVKGAIIVEGAQQRVNMGNFSSDSKVYLRINANCRIAGKGGNGGSRGGQNGQDGQRALYSRTPFIMDNAGIIAGGGGGGGGGNNSNCVYQNTNYFGCMKNQQCSELVQNQSPAYGGGGGGGAGTPGGTGVDDGQTGQAFAGGGGGGDDGCESYSGG